jgi:soluble lytic murein transglycosylase-like protein
MSTASISPAVAGVPSGELEISSRVRQLEALIAQAQGAASGPGAAAPQPSPTDFASALAAAGMPAQGAAPALASSEGASTTQYDALIEAAAQRNGVDPAVLHGLIQQESNFDPGAQSSAGAMGLTQLMPGTASSLGVSDPMNAAESIEGGARYLGQLLSQFGGNTTEALAAYNAGPGAVQQYGGVPPYAETQSYVSKVLGYADAYRQSHPSATPQLGAIA